MALNIEALGEHPELPKGFTHTVVEFKPAATTAKKGETRTIGDVPDLKLFKRQPAGRTR